MNYKIIYKLLKIYVYKTREHEGTERDTEGVGCDTSIDTKVIFVFRKSVFRDVRTYYNLDLRVLMKKQISMIMADLSWGNINIFFMGIQEVSAYIYSQEV